MSQSPPPDPDILVPAPEVLSTFASSPHGIIFSDPFLVAWRFCCRCGRSHKACTGAAAVMPASPPDWAAQPCPSTQLGAAQDHFCRHAPEEGGGCACSLQNENCEDMVLLAPPRPKAVGPAKRALEEFDMTMVLRTVSDFREAEGDKRSAVRTAEEWAELKAAYELYLKRWGVQEQEDKGLLVELAKREKIPSKD